MDTYVILAIVGVILLIAELLLPTGGVLAALGALGMVAGGIVALTVDSGSTAAEIAGPALITLGILSVITSYFVGRKVLAAHRDEPVRTGTEELVGAAADVRTPLDPTGQVWVEGALWRARLVDEQARLLPGDRVTIEAVEGLTLVVRPQTPTDGEQGAN